MKNFEKLWQEYAKAQGEDLLPSDAHRHALRKAFFTGAWCHMTFTKKISGLRGPLAEELIQDLKWELAREVTSPFRRARTIESAKDARSTLVTDSFSTRRH